LLIVAFELFCYFVIYLKCHAPHAAIYLFYPFQAIHSHLKLEHVYFHLLYDVFTPRLHVQVRVKGDGSTHLSFCGWFTYLPRALFVICELIH